MPLPKLMFRMEIPAKVITRILVLVIGLSPRNKVTFLPSSSIMIIPQDILIIREEAVFLREIILVVNGPIVDTMEETNLWVEIRTFPRQRSSKYMWLSRLLVVVGHQQCHKVCTSNNRWMWKTKIHGRLLLLIICPVEIKF
jgi:hypothetical protein